MPRGVNCEGDHRRRRCHVYGDVERAAIPATVELGIERDDRIGLPSADREDEGASGRLRLRCAAAKEETTGYEAEAPRASGDDDDAGRIAGARRVHNDRLIGVWSEHVPHAGDVLWCYATVDGLVGDSGG